MTKYLLFLFILIGIWCLFASSAQAVTFPQNTTLEVTVSGAVNSFTIEAGSEADELVTNTSSFQVKVSPGQNFVVNSTSKKTFNNDSGYATHCATGQSAIAISIAQGEPQKTVIVTPNGDTCALSATGGTSSGGSSTGGAGSSTTSTATTPTATPLAYATPAPIAYVPSSGGVTLKILTATLNVRNSPISGKIVDKVLANQVYTYTATQNGWYKIQKNGVDLGWVSGQYVKVTNAATPTPTPKQTSGTVKVVASVKFLNVRNTSSTAGKIVTKILSGETYTYTATQNGWYKIQKNGADLGWVSGAYVMVK